MNSNSNKTVETKPKEIKSEESSDSDFDPSKPESSFEDYDEDDCLGDDELKSETDSVDEFLSPTLMTNVVNQIIDGKVEPKKEEPEDGETAEKDLEKVATDEDFDLENYRIWKKNCPFLYDLLITNHLEWPTLSIQWYHSKQTKMNPYNYREYFSDKLLFGTYTAGQEQCYLIIATQHFPVMDDAQIAACEGGISHTKYAKLENYVRIIHDGDVNRARYNPQNPFVVATSSSSRKNYLFDYSKHPSEPPTFDFKPELILDYHQKEGFGLCWNNRKSNILATGALDKTICIWDVNSNPHKSKTLKPIYSFKAHKDSVNDVKWHYYHDSYLGSVGGDKMLKFWDLRMKPDKKSAFYGRAHNDGINTLSFNPFCEYIVLTASDDCTIGLFDIRNLKHRLHSFVAHRDEVLDVNWSPYSETVFASTGRDKRLIIWDMTKINTRQMKEAAKEGPPEMIFIHGGHTNVIQDFSWHPYHQFIASVSNNNELHVFKPFIDVKFSI